MADDKKLMGIYLPKTLITELKVFAAQQGRSTSDVVEEMIREFLRRQAT